MLTSPAEPGPPTDAPATAHGTRFAPWSFSDFVLYRKGALPFSALAGLTAARACALLDDAERLRAERLGQQQVLLDGLFALIPRVTPDERRALIKLQRDLFNGRPPGREALDRARQALDEDGRRRLDRWIADHEAEGDRRRAAEVALHEELAASRQTLARLALGEDLRQGLQLSNQALFRTIEPLARDAQLARAGGKKVRHAQATLVSYLYRMALKTSPFGTFTELGLHLQGRPARRGGAEGRRRVVRLARGLLLWVETLLVHRLPECWDALPHWLNNTVRIVDGKLELFVRGEDGTEASQGGERFLRLPLNAAIRTLLEALAAGPRTRAELARALESAGLAASAAPALVDRLVEVGLLERGLGVPDQHPQYARRLAERIAELPGPRAGACAAAVRALCEIERAFPEAAAVRRGELLAELNGELGRIAAAVGIEAPAEDDARSYIYEDLGRAEPARSWDQTLFASERERFTLLQQLLPLFDDGTTEQIALYDLFRAQHGPSGRCEDLLDFYQVFARQDAAAVSALMTGAGQPWAQQIQNLRRQFWALLDEQLAARGAEPGAPLLLDESRLRQLVSRFPSCLEPWPSASYGLQFGGTKDGAVIVLNNVMTGHGWAYSRFCALFEPGPEGAGPSLRELVAERIRARRSRDRQVDLTAVLGMNANLHPRLTDVELVYPRCLGTGEAPASLALRDLALVGDPARQRIQIVSKRDGQPLRLVPLNFLFPAAAANLYRFLCALGPTINCRGGIWGRYLGGLRADDPRPQHLPRVQLGRVVLDRRTWMWPVAALPPAEIDFDGKDPLASLVRVRQWREELALPREGFFRFNPARGISPQGTDWVKELRSWALAARSNRLRKPHYLDFESPLLSAVLFKQLRGMSDGVFTFQECLPATKDYLDGGGPSSAEEHVIELDFRRPYPPNHPNEDESRATSNKRTE